MAKFGFNMGLGRKAVSLGRLVELEFPKEDIVFEISSSFCSTRLTEFAVN
jgi:hypothetical protein